MQISSNHFFPHPLFSFFKSKKTRNLKAVHLLYLKYALKCFAELLHKQFSSPGTKSPGAQGRQSQHSPEQSESRGS